MTELEEHRAVRRLRECATYCNRAWRGMSRWVLESRARGENWPDWCLMPEEGWQAIHTPPIRTEWNDDASIYSLMLPILGTWRLSKGIYRISDGFCAELLGTPMSGDIPVDVLVRMPEWAVYVELNGLLESDSFRDAKGVWVRLCHRMSTNSCVLHMMVDMPRRQVPAVYEVGPWSLDEMVSRYVVRLKNTFDGIMDGYEQAGRPVNREEDHAKFMSEVPQAHGELLSKVMTLLLYICSDKPEVGDREEPEASPSRTGLQRVGPRSMFVAADRPRLWIVGEEIGKSIRRQRDEPEAGGDRKRTRRHLRRAHWHGYWVGPKRSEDREFEYRWIAPTVVGAREEKAV